MDILEVIVGIMELFITLIIAIGLLLQTLICLILPGKNEYTDNDDYLEYLGHQEFYSGLRIPVGLAFLVFSIITFCVFIDGLSWIF